MSNIKSINENSLNRKCITMSDLSNEKKDLFCNDNNNKKIKRFTKRKRKEENSYNRECCYCKGNVSINDSIEFKNKDDLIGKIKKRKRIINKTEIKSMTFKEHQIICESCLGKILENSDWKNKIKQTFFIIKKRGAIKSKKRKKYKHNNTNNENLEEIDNKDNIPSINNGLRQNSLMFDINEYLNCLSYIKQYLISVFRVVLIFGENYYHFLWNMNIKCYTFFQSYIQTKDILQIMFNTGKIIALNFKNTSDNIINHLTILKSNYNENENFKKLIQDKLHCLDTTTNQILFKLANFFNNLNVLIDFLDGK